MDADGRHMKSKRHTLSLNGPALLSFIASRHWDFCARIVSFFSHFYFILTSNEQPKIRLRYDTFIFYAVQWSLCKYSSIAPMTRRYWIGSQPSNQLASNKIAHQNMLELVRGSATVSGHQWRVLKNLCVCECSRQGEGESEREKEKYKWHCRRRSLRKSFKLKWHYLCLVCLFLSPLYHCCVRANLFWCLHLYP